MRNSIFIKGLVIGIIFLLIVSSIMPITGSLILKKQISTNNVIPKIPGYTRGNTLYVGGSGPGNYTKIQDAIDDASDGDTIFVYDYSSPYYENVWIAKSIDLIGEDKNTTIIDGQNKTGFDTIHIARSNVTVSGFTIQHCGTTLSDGGIDIFENNYCTIKNNIITSNEDNGIRISYSKGNTISGNIITNNHGDWYHGIYLVATENNIFVDNKIYENGYGFSMHYSNNNIIKNNIISDNYDEDGQFGTGIWAEFCDNNIFSGNNICNNFKTGIDIYSSCYNNISWNHIEDHSVRGICIRVGSHNNIVLGNYISNNQKGLFIPYECNYNQIVKNNFVNNIMGVDIGSDIFDSFYNIFYYNNFINSSSYNARQGTKANPIWDNGYPLGGNYWDDYNGVDNYRGIYQDIPSNDGLGDTPYNISGSDNKDNYPLINKWGENPPSAYFIYTGEDLTLTFDASISIDRDGTIVEYEWDFGDGTTNTGKIIEHTFTSNEDYTVTLTVTDNDGKKDNISRIVVENNSPPSIPLKPNGQEILRPSESGEYYTTSNDSNDDMVLYRFNWDADGTNDYSGFSSLVPSGTGVNMLHWWSTKGTYIVKAQACDEHGYASNWSEGLTVLINNAPNKPFNPEPGNGTTDVDINADLYWNCSDPDGDNLTYDVYFSEKNPPDKVSTGQTETTYNPGIMEYKTTYYWQIVAIDENSLETNGPIWSFKTCSLPNEPPYIPGNPSPENGTLNVTINVNLSWIGGDPDEDDTVVYDVYLEANDPNPDVKVADDLVETVFNPGLLDHGTVYYWKVVARDNHFADTIGPVWHFTTEMNMPPNPPSIDGPNSGKTGKNYYYYVNSTDPEDHHVFYYVDWGDGTNTDWSGPYISGKETSFQHAWEDKGTYLIKVKAKDTLDAESNWSEFEISIPRTRASSHHWFLERFPLLERLLSLFR